MECKQILSTKEEKKKEKNNKYHSLQFRETLEFQRDLMQSEEIL